MEQREIEVDCPCCDTRLVVDVRTGKVLRSGKRAELDPTGKPVLKEADWSEAHKKVKGRLSTALDRFDEGLDREKRRGHDLDDLFRKVKGKLVDPGDGPADDSAT